MEKKKNIFIEKIVKLWENDKIRFLFVSGFNTLVGLILSLLLIAVLLASLKILTMLILF